MSLRCDQRGRDFKNIEIIIELGKVGRKDMEKEALVLSYLEDELSKFIFECRRKYNQTDDYNVICELVEKCMPGLDVKPALLEKVKDKKKIIVFGAGRRLKRVVDMLTVSGKAIYKIVDNNSAVWGSMAHGIEIEEPDKVDYSDADCIIITPYNPNIAQMIYEQLVNYGVKEERIFKYIDIPLINLDDKIYFDEPFLKWGEEEVFVDAGVLDLDSSFRFADKCKKEGVKKVKVLAFEPDLECYAKCQKILTDRSDLDIKLYDVGLWSEKKILYFQGTGVGSGKVVQNETDESIKVDALDSMTDEKVTFIKMDIEGSELEALKGCKEIIQKYKPTLAISIYHKKEDITDIPIYIKELVPEYKMYIRHYSNCEFETVLYAIP